MGLEREIAHNFSGLDAEVRIKLLIDYIRVLREGRGPESGKLFDGNGDINHAMNTAYKLLEQEFKK
ncbi:hypothetical protein WMW72_10695 [Paenibacillus filicis]|uniref:Uncharacterized protein n=1 Tax=Paenibacillus filicis TaxID=669464 RepID=A0ABU9DJF3_9BACL